MAMNNSIVSKALILLCLTSIVVLTLGHAHPWLPSETPKKLALKLSLDNQTLSLASSDFGFIVHETPLAVFQPSSVNDIIDLIKYSNSLPIPFTIAQRGQAHSTHGQTMTHNGVVLNMTRLGDIKNGSRIVVYDEYVDAGGEQLWIDVLSATFKHGLTPFSWTDYMYLSVGGTLSNAGVNGRMFRFGPQISNVLELDVVTGKGDLVKCSPVNNSELFYAVKRLRLLYNEFSAFTNDQEHLISFHERNDTRSADYVSGYIIVNQAPLDLSFYPAHYQPRITSLVTKYGIIYSIELVKYYDNNSQTHIKEEVASLLKGLNYIPRFAFEKDESYEEFQNRLHTTELEFTSKGFWDVPHPWLNLFIQRSRISDFNEGVLKGIILKQNISVGTPSFYPTNRNKWDYRMSAVTPNEDIFYVLGLYRSSGFDKVEVEAHEAQNQQILQFCKDVGIEIKEYLASYKTHEEWMEQYGSKWQLIEDRKAKFDPKRILSPGQRIFN
ncbi:hypothetical protein TanjilG_09900 [Lupinus angustifolius]|uniref:cytokinin dehydrogenase n=1 Tax=Lupinus angustifolius TaxID=3871 RepID=A0A1J7HCT7_LUPAN|nr:hypothetical protein TanjilG_09900 [Lupinus angustifolius]